MQPAAVAGTPPTAQHAHVDAYPISYLLSSQATVVSTWAELGSLAPGHYDVTWQITRTGAPPTQTFHNAFDVADPLAVPAMSGAELAVLAIALMAASICWLS